MLTAILSFLCGAFFAWFVVTNPPQIAVTIKEWIVKLFDRPDQK